MSKQLFDLVVIGAGPAGLAAGIEAKKHGLKHLILDKGGITNSILHFPIQMIFFTTPELLEIGGIPLVSEREKPTRNEALKYYRKVVGMFQLDVHQYEEVLRVGQVQPHVFRVETAEAEYETRNVVISIGYYDNPNVIGIPGEDLPHVSHYYTEAHPFYDRDVVVIGGKNSAAEAALDLFRGGARVSLVHRGPAMGQTVKYWVRPDIENRFKNGQITTYFNAKVIEVTKSHVTISQDGETRHIPAQQVFRSARRAVRFGHTSRGIQPRNVRDKCTRDLPGRVRSRGPYQWRDIHRKWKISRRGIGEVDCERQVKTQRHKGTEAQRKQPSKIR
jgi:bacillithiol disulfide reductase